MKSAKPGLGFLLVCLVLSFTTASVCSAETATGVVYEDTNRNGLRDEGEAGVVGVMVTNQRDVVDTDSEGRYEIEIDEDDIVNIVKPAGYDLPMDEDFLPQFYYVHNPNGSPKSKHAGVAPTGPLPESVDFALYSGVNPAQFDVILFGDPQPTDYKEVQYIRDDVIAEMIDDPAVEKASFGVSLGDVMNNNLSLYEPYNKIVGQLEKPWINVIGNHDLNFESPTDEFSDETWHRVFGPNYSAFYQGEVLFINLDNVHYSIQDVKDPKTGEMKKKGGYIGLFGPTQIEWAAKILERHDPSKLVVLLMHIPLEREWGGETKDREDLYKHLDGKKVLAIAGHTHTQEHVFIGEHSDALTQTEIHHLINVTVCGAWWKGMKDDRGIPIAITSDGVDNGYTILSIDGSKYTTQYKAANKSWSHQMRIHSPQGHVEAGSPVVVNVQAGSSRSKVAYRVDDGELCEMKRTEMKDPLVERLAANPKDPIYKGTKGPQGAGRCTHMWTASLPEDLEPGTYTVTVVEKDLYGKTHRGSQIFVVE